MKRKIAVIALAAVLVSMLAGGCAAVKPYEREYLSLKIMDFRTEQAENGIERHWLETLEGSAGGVGGSGGGCACN